MTSVLDASALLAFLQDEPGASKVKAVLPTSAISAVNWSEVIQKSVARGVKVEGLREGLSALGLRILPFSAEQAETAGKLWGATHQLGLSLGDRACLSLGQLQQVPILTTDRVWQKLPPEFQIEVLR